MEFVNATRMVTGYTLGTEPSGREWLVIVIKGTFHLPKPGEEVRLHDQQLPLHMADVWCGAPALSAPRYEADFALRKQRCDILLHGSAYAPGGRPATRVPVGLRVGDRAKSFAVVGNRHWQCGFGAVTASAPEAFLSQPIGYEAAFGGIDMSDADPARHTAFMPNPVGRGFHLNLGSECIDGAPLPNTEELERPVTSPQGAFMPMAFGPVGRNWDPRIRYAGTYDQRWLEEHFPFLPPDFDERYYQSAPQDQQWRQPVSGQEVALVNLTPDGHRAFMLPDFEAPVNIIAKGGAREDLRATLDTIVLEPDQERFSMTWRLARPLKRSIFEISQVLVGRKGKEWWQQREQVIFPIKVQMLPVRQQGSPEP
ncbi:DUF2169 family type VI secretion system accessory protein [Pseudoduganella violaceinigra]|uniref:DUF2169 family type VI secretion system accessory protein n=1 Tax=Pseudoduganella violaceinigra TaxID=246602 RepID=UPI00048251E4|nr:DUF2169 domain-containing protein [Pseudoduganella violaceinigra]